MAISTFLPRQIAMPFDPFAILIAVAAVVNFLAAVSSRETERELSNDKPPRDCKSRVTFSGTLQRLVSEYIIKAEDTRRREG